jgi:hypothetical protein
MALLGRWSLRKRPLFPAKSGRSANSVFEQAMASSPAEHNFCEALSTSDVGRNSFRMLASNGDDSICIAAASQDETAEYDRSLLFQKHPNNREGTYVL